MNIFTYLVLVPISIWNLSYHAVYFSLKSNDARVCALSLSFIGAAYSILPITLFTVIQQQTNNQTWYIVLLCYLVILRIGASVVKVVSRKYFQKSFIFTMFRN
jgi:uncharacterized membrane protein YfcA